MRRLAVAVLAAALLGCSTGVPPERGNGDGGDDPEVARERAEAVVAEADRLSEEELWPGFEPTTSPVAIAAGGRTFLFRHPSPPDGFRAAVDRPETLVFPERHPAVAANSTVELGGARTATVLLGPDGPDVRAAAGLLLHELFHVYQRERHPSWTANEADLFTYPVERADPLAARRLESEALRRAVASGDSVDARCWSRAALETRRRRFDDLPPESGAYERGTELNEGLARYVQHRATPGDDGGAILPKGGFPPAAVRQRGYATGLALALLLDRLSPGWPRALEGDPDATLDGLLAEAAPEGGASGCAFDARERSAARATAGRDVEKLRTRRAERLREFRERPGWRIEIAAAANPLSPQGFDPLNVEVVDTGVVLHERSVALGNDAATFEVVGRATLTTAAGEHPLFEGVRALSVTGLEAEPTVEREGGSTRILGEGVEIELTRGEIEREGRTLRIRLGASRPEAGG